MDKRLSAILQWSPNLYQKKKGLENHLAFSLPRSSVSWWGQADISTICWHQIFATISRHYNCKNSNEIYLCSEKLNTTRNNFEGTFQFSISRNDSILSLSTYLHTHKPRNATKTWLFHTYPEKCYKYKMMEADYYITIKPQA